MFVQINVIKKYPITCCLSYLWLDFIVILFARSLRGQKVAKGPYLNDVHTERGRGLPKCRHVREIAWI